MLRILFILLFSGLPHLHAQVGGDATQLDSQNPISVPVSLPLRMNLKGEFSFTGNNEFFTLGPYLQGGYSNSTSLYTYPKKTRFFGMVPSSTTTWIEVKRLRYEYGAGLSALIQNTLKLGIAPFKGAILTMTRIKHFRDERSARPSLPKKLSELEHWGTGDTGNFQTYGGIQLVGGTGIGIVGLVGMSLNFQNQFTVSMRKSTEHLIDLAIEEEHFNRKQLELGPLVSNIQLEKLKGKRFTVNFSLDLSNPEHHELYELALQGKIHEVQEKIAVDTKLVNWTGGDMDVYVGIPWVIGQDTETAHYDYTNEDHSTYAMEMFVKKNTGLLVPAGIHRRFIYENDDTIALFWSSEMSRPDHKMLEKRFFHVGQAIGAEIRNETGREKLGPMVTELGIIFTRAELTALVNGLLPALKSNLMKKCADLGVKCAHEDHASRIIADVKAALRKDWKLQREELGEQLVKEPALINALMKTLSLTKTLYFRFLSANFQSMEGTLSVGTSPDPLK